MAERRVWLGTGAMAMGLGAALLSGAGVAHADGGDDSSGGQQASADPSPSKSGKATANHRRAARETADRSTTPATGARPERSTDNNRTPSTAAARPKPAATVATPVDRTPGLDAPETTPADTSGQAALSAVTDPAPVTVEATAGSSGPAVVAVARKAEIAQAIASAGTVTAARTSALPPATGLAATVLSVLSGLAIQPRQAAATTTAPAPMTTSAPAAVTTSEPLLPVSPTNGVTGVQVGHSRLEMPGALVGDTVAADWYFPTQADGSVDAQGVIWLQHGFGATNIFYSALAQDLARQTNSIVVVPTLSSIPFTFSGGCLNCASSQEAAAALLGPDRSTLLSSATAAGFTGNELPERFVLAGHSAGGGFASAVAGDYLDGADAQYDPTDLVGVVMFDGVSNGALDGSFAEQVAALDAADKPIYQIAAPAQSWNLFGSTTNVLAAARPGDFIGVVLQGGSHVDSMLGVNALFDIVLQLVTKRVPAGNTAATYTLSTGWINDMYAGATPETPVYGLYAASNQQIIMGPTAAVGLPAAQANQLSFGDRIIKGLIDTVGGLFGFQLPPPVNSGDNGLDPNNPVVRVGNGVTGVRIGSAVLDIPCGPNGYAAPANWYFPTQADGTVAANGVIWLQHGFLGFNPWYSDMAQQLAQETNSIVVAPTIFWFDTPICPGCYLGGEQMREGVAEMFQGNRSALNISANAAGLQGTLPEKFILTGHSAGGNFATAVGALITETDQVDNLLGVVMFDGVSSDPLFTDSLTALEGAGIPDYQIAAPPQRWNDYGVATELMYGFYGPDRFYGVQIDNGSHTDVIEGDSLFARLGAIASSIIVKPSPPGGKEAVRTFATGWVNDIYAGIKPTDVGPKYGIYGQNNVDGSYVPDQPITMGRAGATTLPAPPPVDLSQYANGEPWYEQASVKLPFAWGLVNTKAIYTPNPDGTVKVQNSGNYFGPNGLKSSITGTAVSVNDFNTRLNVGFFFGTPRSDEPGNYTILDYGALDGDGQLVGGAGYDWVIVSDPRGFSGYILTRDQNFRTDYPDQYNQLLARARQLGVWGPITPTKQYPPTTSTAALPGPAQVPASVVV